MNDFCHCQTYRRNHQGTGHKLLWDPGRWLRSLGAEQSPGRSSYRNLQSQILLMGWVWRYPLCWPPSRDCVRLESQSMDCCVHMKFLPLATGWASRVITGASMATTHVHALKNQNLGEGIGGLPGLLLVPSHDSFPEPLLNNSSESCSVVSYSLQPHGL